MNRQKGRNSWTFQTKSGGVTSVEFSNPSENWGGLIEIDLNWIASGTIETKEVVCKTEGW